MSPGAAVGCAAVGPWRPREQSAAATTGVKPAPVTQPAALPASRAAGARHARWARLGGVYWLGEERQKDETAATALQRRWRQPPQLRGASL